MYFVKTFIIGGLDYEIILSTNVLYNFLVRVVKMAFRPQRICQNIASQLRACALWLMVFLLCLS